jgi:RHS repeat-associated protein
MLGENPEELISLTIGNKLYEMSNHLGNVLTVINDIKIPISSGGIDVDAYLATVVSTADYSPFGVQLDERTVSAETYRYGFQGQEKDDEIKGAGNSVNYTFRMHDPRLGRFFAVDPLARDYPHNSPYAFSENRLLDGVELEGLEWEAMKAVATAAVNTAKQNSGGAACGGSAPTTSTPASTQPSMNAPTAHISPAPKPTTTSISTQSSPSSNVNNSKAVGFKGAEELHTTYNNGTTHVYTHSDAVVFEADAIETAQGSYMYLLTRLSSSTIGFEYSGENVNAEGRTTLSLFQVFVHHKAGATAEDGTPMLGLNSSLGGTAAVVEVHGNASVSANTTYGEFSLNLNGGGCAACVGADGHIIAGYQPSTGSYVFGIGGSLAWILGGHLGFQISYKP